MKTSKLRAATTSSSVADLTDDDSVLPKELIFEILIRLPVKTLLKMRSVSKSWNYVISTPEFVKAHLKQSVKNREFAHHSLLSVSSGFHTEDDEDDGLRRNSWKSILEFPSISLPEHVKFVKEKLHWITGGGNGGSDSNATWFNPGDEKFGNVALPSPSGDTFKWKLVSSSGNLCMTCDYRNKTDVWIMKEYGLVESWTNVASIPKFVNKVVWPIFISHNDEVLLQDVSGLVWWYVSRDDDTFDRPEDQTRCEFDEGTNLNLYIESLVWPNSP